MQSKQDEALAVLKAAFRRIEASIPLPKKVPHDDSFIYRYENKGIHQAIVQKMARCISGLNAIKILIEAGYDQEIGVLCRTLDEINEDIAFLATAETNSGFTERHKKYLEAFYAEAVFEHEAVYLKIPKPDLLPRKKIRAHTMNTLADKDKISAGIAIGESMGTVFSGYVHAASEHIMDMYGGSENRFHIEGMSGTSRIDECRKTFASYIYRGLMTAILVAKAFGDRELGGQLYIFLAQYEQVHGFNQDHA